MEVEQQIQSEEERLEAQKRQFQKMTEEPIGKLLVGLSIPTILSMMITNIYNMVDTAFVGRLGNSASGATGIVFGYMAILQAFGFLFGQGAGSVMARRLGAKEIDKATGYTTTGFFLSFFSGALIGLLSYLTLDPLIYLLGSTATIAPYAKKYVLFLIISAPFFTSSLTMNNLLRYEGKAKFGTIGLLTGAVINICLDAVFMFGMNLGIMGAGLATAISQCISFSILLSMFLRGKTQTQIRIRYLSKQLHVYTNIIATGFPSLIRQALNSVATILLNSCAGVYGDEAVAAMSIVSRISFFPMAVAIGIGQGFQPISSFNYGAKKFARVRKAFWSAFVGEEVVLCLISIPVYLFAGTLVGLFREDAQVIMYGTRALRLMCVAQISVPITMMVEMGFQSSGQRALASFASTLRSGIIFIPLLLLMAHVRGMSGVQEAQPLAFVISSAIGIFLCDIYMRRLTEKEKA